MNKEENILYENGPFYAYATGFSCDGRLIEIRKNTSTHSVVLGTVDSLEHAIRFIDRAAKYPHRF